MNTKTAKCLISAVKRLPDLFHFYADVSPTARSSQVSVWDSAEHSRC
jgi:hypothetical protein